MQLYLNRYNNIFCHIEIQYNYTLVFIELIAAMMSIHTLFTFLKMNMTYFIGKSITLSDLFQCFYCLRFTNIINHFLYFRIE